MKTIKIHIKQLGAVRNSSIEIKPLMIFSGESGLGKSYVAILVHYFYKLLGEQRLQHFFVSEGLGYETLAASNTDSGSITVVVSQLTTWINQDACDYMRKSVGNPDMVVDINFEIPFSHQEYTLSYHNEQIGLEGKEEQYVIFKFAEKGIRINADSKNIGGLAWSMLLSDSLLEDLFDTSTIDQTFAMVPGRGALLTIPITMQERIRSNGDIYSEFLNDWNVVQSMPPRKMIDEYLLERLSYINGGSIEVDDNGRVLYRLIDGYALPISAAASSIKELAPLYVLLDKYPSNHLSILFEEPEAHLHPQKQVDIADFVVAGVNHGMHLQITTHSDYFLRRLNDRIFLYKIADFSQDAYKETILKFGYTDLMVNPSLIGSYLLQRHYDGSVQVVSQDIEHGIPYETFYHVISKETRYSLDIQQKYFNLLQAHAE